MDEQADTSNAESSDTNPDAPWCPRCPRCRGEMDTGHLATQHPTYFISDNRKKRFLPALPVVIGRAYACHHCGFVQMFLDPKQLQQHLS